MTAFVRQEHIKAQLKLKYYLAFIQQWHLLPIVNILCNYIQYNTVYGNQMSCLTTVYSVVQHFSATGVLLAQTAKFNLPRESHGSKNNLCSYYLTLYAR